MQGRCGVISEHRGRFRHTSPVFVLKVDVGLRFLLLSGPDVLFLLTTGSSSESSSISTLSRLCFLFADASLSLGSREALSFDADLASSLPFISTSERAFSPLAFTSLPGSSTGAFFLFGDFWLNARVDCPFFWVPFCCEPKNLLVYELVTESHDRMELIPESGLPSLRHDHSQRSH